MGEVLTADQPEDRNIPAEKLDEPMTDRQRERLIARIDEKNTNKPKTTTVHHEHRKSEATEDESGSHNPMPRGATDITSATTPYEPFGYSVKCAQNRDLRVLTVVQREQVGDGIEKVTERYFEASPAGRDDDYYDMIERHEDAKSGKIVGELPQVAIAVEDVAPVLKASK